VSKPILIILLIVGAAILMAPGTVLAQDTAGENLPAGVEGEDVYRVASQMYCEVCQGVPLSSCSSVTCTAWRQQIATMLGQGFEDQEIFTYFSERYGDEVTGIPLEGEQRDFALVLPLAIAIVVGLAILWRVRWMQGESQGLQVARAAGLHEGFARPVPDNVDREYLERFLALLKD
jgi:formate-dependent nitrite reductase complex subunit NrfF